VERGLVEYRSVQIRDYAQDKHRSCDDAPYGGGAGMLMLAEPLALALQAQGIRNKEEGIRDNKRRVIYLSPSGSLFNQSMAEEFSKLDELVLICGRYEGIDQRVIDLYADGEVSVGDYVLSSGEVGALAVIDATYRLLDGTITSESLAEESFSGDAENRYLLEYPQWTRPELFEGLAVPEILLSGHHAKIQEWRLEQRIRKTLAVRPELIEAGKKNGIFSEKTLSLIDKISQNLYTKNTSCVDTGEV
jgi:tRNA (guanine37-N1)-methyltransferase